MIDAFLQVSYFSRGLCHCFYRRVLYRVLHITAVSLIEFFYKEYNFNAQMCITFFPYPYCVCIHIVIYLLRTIFSKKISFFGWLCRPHGGGGQSNVSAELFVRWTIFDRKNSILYHPKFHFHACSNRTVWENTTKITGI